MTSADDIPLDPVQAKTPAPGGSSRRSKGRGALSWVLTVVVALAATFAIKTWVLQVYSIPSESMVPALMIDDRVVVSKLSGDPGRGDIIVFDRPQNDVTIDPAAPKVLIKRVIGLGGETVDAPEGLVTIDGKPLDESYLPDGTRTVITAPIVVPEGKVLVMGDNRGSSKDGRVFGPISTSTIVGRGVLRVWPLDRFGGL